MNRRNRTLIVLLVAAALASAATFFVYRAITRIPVQQVEVASVLRRRRCREPAARHAAHQGARSSSSAGPPSSPVQGSFASPRHVVGRGLIQPVPRTSR